MEAGSQRVVIMGAGPAGLTAAYQLAKRNVPHVVLEKDDVVGGISRTANHKGFLFDIGGHRFFTKVKAVDDMWREVLPPEEFPTRGRLSRIYYNRKFFSYPLQPMNALCGLGPLNCLLVLLSYFRAQLFPIEPERNFEEWVTNRFGKRLYRIFFKTYTEKVWGIPCDEISADWAAQRIKGLSLVEAVRNAFLQSQPSDKGKVIKTLINAFEYPLRGPGMMWERVAELIRQAGGELRLRTESRRVLHASGRVTAVETHGDGKTERVEGTHFISSAPLRELILNLDPPAPAAVCAAAEQLRYRDFLTVALVIDRAELFPDNWIYVHAPEVRVGRIQNFKNWSPDMVPDAGKTCLGLEYFCREGDDLWSMPDVDLVALARREIAALRLASEGDVVDGAVVRMPKAYPVYDGAYREAVESIRAFLCGMPNLQAVGRNGMHRYNNQDHSMLTAMLAVENIMGASHDLWQVNLEDSYHEEVRDGDPGRGNRARVDRPQSQPLVPERVKKESGAHVAARSGS